MPLKIMPHGRLQEWVAEEKGFFAAEGLDYTFVLNDSDYGIHTTRRDDAGQIKTGAFETFGAGRDGADVSCACHWATNVAAGERAGQLVAATRQWTEAHHLFSGSPAAGYDESVLV